MRLVIWLGVLVAIGWGISLVVQQFLTANPRPSISF